MDIYQEIKQFYKRINTEKRIIGKSELGRDIFAIKLGIGSPIGIVQYAIHGREFLTARLAKTHYRTGIEKGSVWLVPLVNPDGALLSQIGIASVADERVKKRLLDMNKSQDFSLWKANARGVDLNVNFPARWGKGEKNLRVAGAENYIGAYPFSEKETRALREFTLSIFPDYTVSYHTKGEEIYWEFGQKGYVRKRDKFIANAVGKSTGYKVKLTPNSTGGYKDWCVQQLKIPALTIEVGADELNHPIGEEYLDCIYQKNKNVIGVLTKTLVEKKWLKNL